MNSTYDHICRTIGKHYRETDILANCLVFDPSEINLPELSSMLKSDIRRGALRTHEIVGVSWLSGESGYVLSHRYSGHIEDQDIIDAFEHSRYIERMLNSPVEGLAKQANL